MIVLTLIVGWALLSVPVSLTVARVLAGTAAPAARCEPLPDRVASPAVGSGANSSMVETVGRTW